MSAADEKTFADLLRDLWRAKMAVVGMALAGLIFSVAFIVSATPYYKASMIVSPASPMNGAEISSLLANDDLFALRYLVQRVGVANSSDFLRFEHVYDGPSVASMLLEDPNILSGLKRDPAFETPKGAVKPEALSDYLQKKAKLEPVGGSSLRRLVYWHPDRDFAVYFLKQLHASSDALIRRTIREETEGRITHLKQAIATTQNPEHRRVLTTLLLEQERLRMLVSIEQPYAAAVVEPAAASVKPLWPDVPLIMSVLTLAGAFLGFVFYQFASGRGEQKQRPKRWFRSDYKNANERQEQERRLKASGGF